MTTARTSRAIRRIPDARALASARRGARTSGFALPLALLFCVALGAIAVGAVTHSLLASRVAANFDSFHRALDVAEAGLEAGVEALAAAYEAGTALPDSSIPVAAAGLNGFAYTVSAETRREPATIDLNGNGVRGEIVRYARSWGYAAAAASGGPGDEGEPVRRLVALATGPVAGEELWLEVAFERDLAVPDPGSRGAWRAIRLRWSSLDDPHR